MEILYIGWCFSRNTLCLGDCFSRLVSPELMIAVLGDATSKYAFLLFSFLCKCFYMKMCSSSNQFGLDSYSYVSKEVLSGCEKDRVIVAHKITRVIFSRLRAFGH